MIDKKILQLIISKYHLGGLIDSVKWVVLNNNLNIKFMSPNQDMLGDITVNNFSLKDAEIAIFDTVKLNKLLSITNNSLEIEFLSTKKVLTKMIINDGMYNLEYPLADLLVIPKVASLKDPGSDITADILKDIPFIVKAQNALDTNQVYLVPSKKISGDDVIEVNFGEDNSYSNRISYYIDGIEKSNNMSYSLLFDSNLFKEILKNNSNASSAKMYLCNEGLMKLEFIENDIISKYFLVKKDNI